MLTLDTIPCCANLLPHLLEIAANINKMINIGKKMCLCYYEFPVHALNETTVTILHHIL